MWAQACLLALLPLVTVRAISDPSPWLHLRVGKFLLDGHRFGQPDPWAPFAGHTYVPTQWLPSVVVAKAYAEFGLGAVAWTRGVGIVALVIALLWMLRSVSRPWVAATVAAAAVAAGWAGMAERPQLAGFILLVVAIGGWWRTGNDHRARWWLVPLTWVGACTHGVWALGLVTGGLVVLGLGLGREITPRRWWALVGVLVACAGAAALTPLGPRLLLTPLSVGSNGRQFVSEWFPSSVRDPHVMLALLLAGLVYVGWSIERRRPAQWKVLMLTATIVFVLSMERTVAVGAFLVAPLLAEQVEGMLVRRQYGTTALGPVPTAGGVLVLVPRRELAAWLVGLLAACLLAAPLAQARSTVVHGVPMALAQEVRALPTQTRIIADGDVTGWLLFEAPQVQPLFDLRIESYRPDYVTEYISAMEAAPGWDRFIARGSATAALLPDRSPLGLALVEQLGWTVTAHSDGYELLRSAP